MAILLTTGPSYAALGSRSTSREAVSPAQLGTAWTRGKMED